MCSFRFFSTCLAIGLFFLVLPHRTQAQQQESVPITFQQFDRQTRSGIWLNCASQLVGIHADPVGNGNDSDYSYQLNPYTGSDPSDWTGLAEDIPGERITFATRWHASSGPDANGEKSCNFRTLSPPDGDLNAYYTPPPNEPPTACFTFEEADELLTIDFDGSCSDDEDGDVVSYDWDFGGAGRRSGSGAQTSFTYEEGGEYEVMLVVTDDDGDDSEPESDEVEVEGPALRFILSLEEFSETETASKRAEDDEATAVQVGDSVLVKIKIENTGDLPLEDIQVTGGEGGIDILSDTEDALMYLSAKRESIERLEPEESDSLLFIYEAVHEVETVTVSVQSISTQAVTDDDERHPFEETVNGCSIGSKMAFGQVDEDSSGCAQLTIGPAPLVVNSTGDAELDDNLDPEEDGCSTGESIVRDGETEAECTLRAAMQVVAARTDDAPVEIVFDIPENNAVHKIVLDGDLLPAVKAPVSILGTSQPDSKPIEVDGSGLEGGTGGIGFDLGSSDNSATVEGLAFYGFPGTVLALRGSGSSVTGSFFGSDWAKSYTSTDASITDALRNGGIAILITGDRTVVGGSVGEGNLIIGSKIGIRVDGAWNVDIQGNDIGVLESPHAENGIELMGGREATIGTAGAPNTIAYNLGHGIFADEASNPLTIQGNEIIRSRMDGIHLMQSSSTVDPSFIGGDGEGEGNTIERSIRAGIRITGAANATQTEDASLSIQGNTLKENEEIGILLDGGSHVRIGGATGAPGSGAGNEIEDGIRLDSGYASWVQGNKITNLNPETGFSEAGDVIHVKGIRNSIGGETPGEGNVIYGVPNPDTETGNTNDPGANADGFGITDEGTETIIQHNFVGNDGSGAMPLYTGVVLRGNRAQVIENVLSGNSYTGLSVRANATIEGNFIGTTATGNGSMPNGGPGVELWTGATLGGVKEGEACERPCNVISGNTGPGILIRPEASGAKIQGNMIGVGADGLAHVGNGESGIVALADGVVIGGENDVELLECKGPCNIIAANGGDGIRNFEVEEYPNLTSSNGSVTRGAGSKGASGFVIEGNFIGTGLPIPGSGNAGHGIALGALGSNHKVGGTGTGEGNLITGNGGAGVIVLASTEDRYINVRQWVGGHGNRIRGNRIHGNGSVAIDLYPNYLVPGGDGWNALDTEDLSYGPNTMLNWPYLVESGEGGAQGSDLLVLWAGPPDASSQTYSLDIYTNTGCRGAMGEAGNYLVSRNVTFPVGGGTNVNAVRVDVPLVPSMPYYSATLTDSEGNTSEVSNCRRAGQRPQQALQNVGPGIRTLINRLLITLREDEEGTLAGKSQTDLQLLVLQLDETLGDDLFEQTAAQTPDGAFVMPQSTQGGYWEIVAPGASSALRYDVCLDASEVSTPDEALVLGRGAMTNGAWRPFDTRLETVDGVAYACADGLSAQQLTLGSGIAAVMAAPALLTPGNNTTEIALGMSFTWQPLSEAATYDIQVALSAGFSTLLYEESGITGTTTTPSELANNQEHYWRVRGVTAAGEVGPWSLPFRFTTVYVNVDVEEEARVPEQFVLEANYPNPFNPQTTIGFALPRASAVRLIVYDVLGRAVARLVEGTMAAGQHEVIFDASGLPTGVYLYRLEADGFVQTRRMLLVK